MRLGEILGVGMLGRILEGWGWNGSERGGGGYVIFRESASVLNLASYPHYPPPLFFAKTSTGN